MNFAFVYYSLRTRTSRNSGSMQSNRNEFPYKTNIECYVVFVPIILLLIYGVTIFWAILFFSYCDPIERLEPCEFNGKLKYFEINLLRKEIKEVQKNVDEITSVLRYNLSTEASNTLLQKQNSINVTLQTLKERFNEQKTQCEKCYYNNFKINSNNFLLFVQITAIIFAILVLVSFSIAFSYFRIAPVAELNEDEVASYHKLYEYSLCWIGFVFIIICTFISIIFINGVERNEKMQDIPIFVAQSWVNTCSRNHYTITADEFLTSKS